MEAWPAAEEVLRPLARHALVLVGTRELAAPGGGDSLVTRLQPDATGVVHLLAEVDDPAGIPDAFRRLEATRKPRTSRVQLTSRTNTWLRERTDVDWVYSYNPWTAPLAA